MKKIVLVLAMVALTFSMNAQLSSYSQLLRDNVPDTYAPIKANAVNEWASDHKMVVYSINKQTKALKEILGLSKTESYDENVLVDAMLEWDDKIVDGLEFTDWAMTLYTYKKQIKNKDY